MQRKVFENLYFYRLHKPMSTHYHWPGNKIGVDCTTNKYKKRKQHINYMIIIRRAK